MGKKERKAATNVGLPSPEIIPQPSAKNHPITREAHLRNEIDAIREATEKEVNAVVERARKATMPISGAAATLIGQNKREFDAKLANLRLAKDGRIRSAEVARDANMKKVKDDFNKTCRDAETVFAEARDRAVDVEHHANAPIEDEMRKRIAAIEEKAKQAVQAITTKAEILMQPHVDELKKIEADSKKEPEQATA